MVVFTSIMVVLILALGPSGLITQQTDDSIELAVNAIHVMADCICYDVDGNPCPPVNNDGCCYPGTSPGTDNDCNPFAASPCNNNGFCESGENCVCADCMPCSTCSWSPWTPQTLCNAPCGGTGTFTEGRSCSCGPPAACPPDADLQATSRIQTCTSSCVCNCSWVDACGTPPCCGMGGCPANSISQVYICSDISCPNHNDTRCTFDACCNPYTSGACMGSQSGVTCGAGFRIMLPPAGCATLAPYCVADPACVYQCTPTGTVFPNPPFVGVCPGDDTGLTASIPFTAVVNGGCTAGTKCEVECRPTFVTAGANCVCPLGQVEVGGVCVCITDDYCTTHWEQAADSTPLGRGQYDHYCSNASECYLMARYVCVGRTCTWEYYCLCASTAPGASCGASQTACSASTCETWCLHTWEQAPTTSSCGRGCIDYSCPNADCTLKGRMVGVGRSATWERYCGCENTYTVANNGACNAGDSPFATSQEYCQRTNHPNIVPCDADDFNCRTTEFFP